MKKYNIFYKILKERSDKMDIQKKLPLNKLVVVPDNQDDKEIADQMTTLINMNLMEIK